MEMLKIKKAVLFIIMACIMLSLVLSFPILASDFPYRIDSQKRSEKEGLGHEQVPLFKRIPCPGKEAVAKKLIEHFKDSIIPIATKGASKEQVKGELLSITGDGWFLDVYGDGSNVSYRNYKYIDSKPELAKPVSMRLSNEKLRELGLEFIRKHLSEYIKLGPDEKLIPFYTEHAIVGGGFTKENTKMEEEKVYASTIVFTRSIKKVNIIGAGSKVAVMFNNEGIPIGFNYDWPQYMPIGKSQKVLTVEAIKKRAEKLLLLDINSANVKIKRFDCGFYDAGSRKRDFRAVIQTGCAIHSYEKKIIDEKAHKKDFNSGHIILAYVDYIPAGVTVEQDEKWPQAMKILNKLTEDLIGPKDGPK